MTTSSRQPRLQSVTPMERYKAKVNGVALEFEYVYDEGEAVWFVKPSGFGDECLFLTADGGFGTCHDKAKPV